jgi:hypothetical protein
MYASSGPTSERYGDSTIVNWTGHCDLLGVDRRFGRQLVSGLRVMGVDTSKQDDQQRQ